MAGDMTVKIDGLEEAKAMLRSIPTKLRKRALRNALAAGARVVRDAARKSAPVISPSATAVAKGYRNPGTVRDAIVVRTSKKARKAGDVGVFVNVRPAKGAKYKTTTTKGLLGGKRRTRTLVRSSQRGAKVPTDPFYWRFLEFGTKRARPFPFLKSAAGALDQALQAFKAALLPQLARLNNNPKDPL